MLKFISKKLHLLVCLPALFIVACNNEETPIVVEEEEEQEMTIGEWELSFEEDFSGDLSLWNIWDGGAFNEEIQLYRQNQLTINEGILTITAQRQDVMGATNPFDATPKSFEYVSGRIESKETFGPTLNNGNREIRMMASIKLPSGNGMWPAFWSYGDPWPTQGEIDILEARGSTPLEFQSNLFYGPTANININQGNEQVHEIGENLTEDFHTYEMVWTADTIQILFDGQLLHTYESNSNNNINNMLNKKQMVVLNIAVGGLFFSNNNQDSANYADTATMEVDWVKVYSR
jgi:beta-glucanase (GH16 family)